MKNVWIVVLAHVICTAEAEEPWQNTNYGAVTSFEGLEDYYRGLAQQGLRTRFQGAEVPSLPRQHEQQWTQKLMQAEICESILSADFFRVRFIAPYNVSEVEASSTVILGCFVFQIDTTPSPAVLRMVALAEGGAILSERSRLSASWTYALVRWNEKPAEAANLDPVCSLSPVNKLRLCSILFGSSAFRSVAVGSFEPVLENVYEQCDKRMVTLPSLGWTFGRIYEEWVIGCIATTRINERITYYVSRGKEQNTIFVFFSGINNRPTIVLHHFYYNVSVVDKMYVSDTRSTVDALV